jgi:hypothetical protein
MKVISRTLLALATGAVGVMTTPAFAAPGVHLVTSIKALSHAPDGVHYAVTVRPVGGPAHATTLVLSTRRPAAWTAGSPECLSSADRTALACDLGDVRQSERRTLHVTAHPGNGRAEVPVIAQAGAANAPSVTSSLGVNHPASLRLAGDEPPAASPEPSQEPSPSASPEVSPPAESPSAAPSEDEDAPGSPAVILPQGPSSPAARPRAPRHQAPAAAPPHAPAHARPPAVPHAPVIPHLPVAPVPPAAEGPALPPPNAPLGGPPPAPAAPGAPVVAPVSPALPQLAPHPSPGSGVSELVSPAGAMQAGRTSWATLIAVAVAAEAGLLWLIAGLTVWRRKRTPEGGGRRRTLSRRLAPSRLIP